MRTCASDEELMESFLSLRQTPSDVVTWLNRRLTESFNKSGMDFKAEYINSGRSWTSSLQNFSTLGGAYRKRKMLDEHEIPHSFTFCRWDCALASVS